VVLYECDDNAAYVVAEFLSGESIDLTVCGSLADMMAALDHDPSAVVVADSCLYAPPGLLRVDTTGLQEVGYPVRDLASHEDRAPDRWAWRTWVTAARRCARRPGMVADRINSRGASSWIIASRLSVGTSAPRNRTAKRSSTRR
jgi:hypothetical protein